MVHPEVWSNACTLYILFIYICNSVHGSKELSIYLSSLVFGLRLMSCKVCGRPGVDLCPGCRTCKRIQYLWEKEIKGGNSQVALHLLRDCAGALTDLVESQHQEGTKPPAPGRAASSALDKAQPGGGAKPAGVKAPVVVKEETKEKEREARPVEGEAGPREEKKARSPTPEADSEETEEEHPKAEDPVGKPEKFFRGSLGIPLGLKKLPQQLSPSDIPEPELKPGQAWARKREDVAASQSRKPEVEAPREEKREAPKGDRSPSRPPGGWEEPRRKRSRSGRRTRKEKKDRGSKGKKKRERGRDWWRHRQSGTQDQWHRKQRDWPRQRRG